MTDTNIPDFNLVTPGLQLGATAKALTGAERKLIRGSDLALTMMWKNLVVGDDNIRDAAATDIEGLADSIRRVGLIEPIVVEQHSKDKWLVAAGHRRYLALQHLVTIMQMHNQKFWFVSEILHHSWVLLLSLVLIGQKL